MQVYLFRRNNVYYYVKVIRRKNDKVLIQSLTGSWLLREWVEKSDLIGPIELQETVYTEKE